MSESPGAAPPGGSAGRPPGNRGGAGPTVGPHRDRTARETATGTGTGTGTAAGRGAARHPEETPRGRQGRTTGGQRAGSSARGGGRGSPRRSGSRSTSASRARAHRRGSGETDRSPTPQAVDRQTEGTEETSAVRANRRRAGIICVTPGLIAGVVVGLVLVAIGLPLIGALAWVAITGVVSAWLWRFAPRAVARSVGARPSDESEHPRLHNLVDGLCATMGLPRPAICIVDSPMPNAMAVGRDPATASLLVTSGLDRVPRPGRTGRGAGPRARPRQEARHPGGRPGGDGHRSLGAAGGHGQGRRNGAFPGRPGPGVLGRSAGGRGGPLSRPASARHWRRWPIGRRWHRPGRRVPGGPPNSPAGCGSTRWRVPRSGAVRPTATSTTPRSGPPPCRCADP